MLKNSFKTSKYPFTLQCTYKGSACLPDFTRLLDLLSFYGFYGIELNLPDLDSLPARELQGLLENHGLDITYIATGAYAVAHHFSLSSEDKLLRQKSLEGCMANIDYAAQFHCGIIIGYMKNNPHTPCHDASRYLEESLAKLDEFARPYEVPILLEATNRYESQVANSLEETLQIIQRVQGKMLSILPDTFHMNIEERCPLKMLSECQSHFHNLHLSDNNRYFPGLGCISFENYLKKLQEIHYQGPLGIEGILKDNLENDLETGVRYLSGLDWFQ